MTNYEYGYICLFSVFPFTVWVAHKTGFWHKIEYFKSEYALDFLSLSNLQSWCKKSKYLRNIFFLQQSSLDKKMSINRQRKTPVETKHEETQQSAVDMAEILGDAFIHYLDQKRALTHPNEIENKVAQPKSPSKNSDAAGQSRSDLPNHLPDNVVPLFADVEIEKVGGNSTNNNVDDFTGAVHIDGEQFQLSEEETQIIKDSYRAALNGPSNPRERMFRDFLEQFYTVTFEKGVAHLVVELSNLRIEARKLLLIETDYGKQYEWVNDELRQKPNRPNSD